MLFDNRKMQVYQIEFSMAASFVNLHHRHNKAPQGHKFSLGLFVDFRLVGVAIVGRPVSRRLDNGGICEITRVCVLEGIRNGCSKLYAYCCRFAKKIGYKKVITYIRVSEFGASLKASGFSLEAENVGGLEWKTRGSKCKTNELKNRYSKNV